jgi:hypothetical protein
VLHIFRSGAGACEGVFDGQQQIQWHVPQLGELRQHMPHRGVLQWQLQPLQTPLRVREAMLGDAYLKD